MLKPNFRGVSLIKYFCLGASALYCIIYFIFACLWLFSPYPNEYREFANIDITRMFLEGKNPYDISNIPPFFYVYGFIMPLLTSWLYSAMDLLHIDLLIFQRSIALICTFLCGWIAAKEVKKRTHSGVYGFLAFSITLISGWSMGLSVALPNTMGVFIMLFILSEVQKIKSVVHIGLIAFLTVLVFFIKQYFIIVLVPVFIWLLFRSKKFAFYYFLFSVICFFVAAVIVDYLYPAFFSIAIVHHLSMASHSLSHLLKQLAVTGLFYFPLFLLFLSIVFNRNKNIVGQLKNKSSKSWNAPLVQLSKTPDIYGVAVCIYFIVIFRLGMHVGAYMTYIYQLLVPVLAIYVLSYIDMLKKERLKNIALVGIVVFSLYHIGLFINIPRMMSSQEKSGWESFYKILDADKTRGLCIYSPLLAKYAWDNSLPVWNNGQTEYISTLQNRGVTDRIFPEANRIALKNNEQMMRFYQQISASQPSVIITDNLSFLDTSFLKENGYCITDSAALKAGSSASYTVYRWIPCRSRM
ncbi:hypothetical protein [Coprobacter sp.]